MSTYNIAPGCHDKHFQFVALVESLDSITVPSLCW
jgi:hypothetical protein